MTDQEREGVRLAANSAAYIAALAGLASEAVGDGPNHQLATAIAGLSNMADEIERRLCLLLEAR